MDLLKKSASVSLLVQLWWTRNIFYLEQVNKKMKLNRQRAS